MTRTQLIRRKIAEKEITVRALSEQTGIALRTLQRHIADPDSMTLGELRAIHNRLRFSDEELAKLGRSL